jgi:hypothetical protein
MTRGTFTGDKQFARLMESYARLCGSPTTYANHHALNLALDVRAALSTIRAPTLVAHNAPSQRGVRDASADDDPADGFVVEESRNVAGLVPVRGSVNS